MAYRIIQTDFAGEVSVNPRLDRMITSDTLSTILAPGYLNRAAEAAGVNFEESDFVFINYNNGAGGTQSNLFTLNVAANGVITLVRETGTVQGPGPITYDNQVVLFADTSGSNIKGVDFTPVDNSLLGYNGTATPANITVTSPLSISNGVLSSSASGGGNVIGPGSASIVGALSVFTNTNGEHIGEPTYTPAANSLIGYGATTNAVVNITAGTNVTISGGTISVESGAGNVTGSGTPTPLTFPVYSDNTGLAIEPAASVTLTGNNLIGTNAGGTAFTNITAGTGINISAGVITATGAGLGTVTGPVGSVVNGALTVWNASNTEISEPAFTPATHSLLGYVSNTVVSNITIGANLAISNTGVLSATAGGTVSGPGSVSVAGALTVWTDTSGTEIKEPAFTPAANSLIGYGPSTNAIVNITAGANINISDSGVISASGGAGGGDVTGPDTSFDGNFALYSGDDGKFIQNTSFTPSANMMIGYNSAAQVSQYIIQGYGISNTTSQFPGYLIQRQQVITTNPGQLVLQNYGQLLVVTGVMTLPANFSTVLFPGWYVTVFADGGANLVVTTGTLDVIQFVNHDGTPLANPSITVNDNCWCNVVYAGTRAGRGSWIAYGFID